MSTKGIILATFGSIYGEAVEKSVGIMEAKIKKCISRCSNSPCLFRRMRWWRSGMKKYEKPVQSWKPCWLNLRIPASAMYLFYHLPW